MSDQDRRGGERGQQAGQIVEELGAGDPVDPRQRLVEQGHRRAQRQGTGEVRPLRLPSGELPGRTVEHIQDPTLRGRLGDAGRLLHAREAAQAERELEIPPHGPAHEHLFLEGEGRARRATLLPVRPRVSDSHMTRAGRLQAGHHAEERGLP